MVSSIYEIIERVKSSNNLIHCITNYISANDCANAIIALGNNPIMAEHPLEVKEITEKSKALYINLGSISDSKMKAILTSSVVAFDKGIPRVLDLTGVAGSILRREFAKKIIEKTKPNVIKGNSSEIFSLMRDVSFNCGVDVLDAHKIHDDNLEEKINLLLPFAKKIGATLVISGAIDIVIGDEDCFIVKNGHTMMSKITGSGCLLGAIITTFIATLNNEVNNKTDYRKKMYYAVLGAISYLGICGELAGAEIYDGNLASFPLGCGSFRVRFIDWISLLNKKEFCDRARIIKIR